MGRTGRFLRRFVLAMFVLLAAAEAYSRLDDWIFNDVPFFANPDREHDLTVRDEEGVHGRPHGRFRKWHLNAFGFRGPEIDGHPARDSTRILILGASETFGLYESENKEYPAQLAELLRRDNRSVEVVNAAMAGISVTSMLPYWNKWAARVHPKIVLIYPSPMFYLDDEPPKPPSEEPATEEVLALSSRSRFAGRVWDTLRRAEWLRWARREWQLWRERDRQDPNWMFRAVPPERLEQFRDDLLGLTRAIRARGAEPVLITHAIRAASPPRPEDQNDLRAMNVFAPRATADTIVVFEDAVAQVMRELGRQHKITVIDAAAEFDGIRDLFADLVHFNDQGARAFASYLADRLQPLLKHPDDKPGHAPKD